MKLLTLNCHSWQEENQIQKIKEIAKVIVKNNYDVIALQEVSQLIKSEIIYENIKKDNFVYVLNEEIKNLGCFDYEFIWSLSHIGFDIYEEGLAILTKLPIINKDSFFVSESVDIENYKTRKIIKATLNYNNKEIDFYSCHMGWWNDGFKEQLNNLKKSSNFESKLSFFMGDFNNDANKRNEGYDYIIQNKFFDTYSLAKEKDNGITVKGNIAGWKDNKGDLRLDLILCNENIDVISSKVIFNGKNENIVSDHFGVEAILL